MKKKLIIVISIIVVIVIGLVIGLTIFIKEFNEDREKTLAIMDEIKLQYKSFSPLVETFSGERAKFYTAKDELFYLESIETNKEQIYSMMTNYNDMVMNIHNTSTYLQNNCKRKYSSSSVNNTCDLFKQEYEAVINYYLTDIGVYNGFVKEYNNWLTENSMTLEPLVEQTFELYSSYIDYDEDGSYLGGK